MKKLIVNADDFGLDPQINKGIIRGYAEGFITSASLMPSAPFYDEAVCLARANPGLGVGVHFTLVGGVAPVLPPEKCASLLDGGKVFASDYAVFAKNFYSGRVARRELEEELRAQIEKVLASGLNVTHLDSHQHTHVLPGVWPLVQKLCAEYGIRRVRIPRESYFFTGGFHSGVGRFIGRGGLSFCAALAARQAKKAGILFPEHFFGMLAGGNLNEDLVGNIIRALPEGVSEIMTHPGLDSAALNKKFTWNYHWENELQAFLAARNKRLLKDESVVLTNFGGLNHD